MINNTTLVGRLTKDPELKYTASGVAVTNFTMAVERNFTNAQGERETDFIQVVAWRGTAENIANLALRGSLIGITGSIQTRTYENNQGQTVYVTEVLIDDFQMLEPKSVTDARRNRSNQSGGQNYQKQSNNQSATNKKDDNPFANFDNDNPFEVDDDPTDISDDDLPF